MVRFIGMVGQPRRNFTKMASWSRTSEHLVNPIGMSDQLKWNNQFNVNINDTTYINGRPDEYEVSTYKSCCQKVPLCSDSDPQTLYNNVWLLTYGINRIRDDLHGELSLGISNKVIIPYNELDIYPQQ